MKTEYGCKVYKVPVNAGFTCPNRDGSLGTDGCLFCSGIGSGEFAGPPTQSISQQIDCGIEKIRNKVSNGKYIAYFQAFTNTYAPVPILRAKYLEAVSHPDIVVLSIATRPDCLDPSVIELLREINRIKPVWIELGLQTIHPETAKLIRRGYDLDIYDDAVKRLKACGLTVITHMILGLPGETKEMMLQSASYIGKSGADGIKLQLLHVIEGTDLAKMYRSGRFSCLSEDGYIDLVVSCLKELPDSMVIHRMTGDGDKRTLIAPLWSGNKKKVINHLHQRITADCPFFKW